MTIWKKQKGTDTCLEWEDKLDDNLVFLTFKIL